MITINLLICKKITFHGDFKLLSHTWVWYPGFSGHGIKCPILTTVVPGFSGDLIDCTIRSKWDPFGDLYLARNIIFCLWNKLFLSEKSFFPKENSSCEVFMVTNCPYAGINKWMEKSNNFWNNGKTSNSGVLIDEINIEILEIYQNLKISLDSVLNFFTRYKYIVVQRILRSIYTCALGAIFQHETFVMLGARVTTGTIMTSQVNVVASP